jgi:hypothetical protein
LNDLILVLPETARRIAPTLRVTAASVIPGNRSLSWMLLTAMLIAQLSLMKYPFP